LARNFFSWGKKSSQNFLYQKIEKEKTWFNLVYEEDRALGGYLGASYVCGRLQNYFQRKNSTKIKIKIKIIVPIMNEDMKGSKGSPLS
jgi:hypothetical protein